MEPIMKMQYSVLQILVSLILCAIFILPLCGELGAANDQDTRRDSSNIANVDIDTLQLISNITAKLETEIASPSNNFRPVGLFGTISETAVREMIFQLADLGPAYSNEIYNEAMSKNHETQRALIISLGLMKDIRVHDDLREIVRTETNPNIRAMAVRALSTYKDMSDMPLFLDAVADTNIVVMELDVPTLDGQFHKQVNMVGMEAVPAIYKLGYKPVPDSINGGYKAVKLDSDK
jgi:hypothetical protein